MKWNVRRLFFPAVGIIIFLIIGFGRAENTASEDVSRGIKYLKGLEAKNTEEVEKKVKEVRRNAREKAIEEGELSVWAQFSDYVFFGDSRTVGLYYHEFLERQRVMAEGGLTIADIPTYIDQMKVLNPSYLFLCTGLNDVSIGYWKTPDEYVAAYEEQIEELQKNLPDTHIYINSIFPAQDPAFERDGDWRNIPEYNEAIKKWCEEKGYSYIDNTEVYEAHKDLYDVDGIHFQKEFYEYWANNILSEVDM